MTRCPVCSVKLRNPGRCHRCRTDLAPLTSVEEDASRHLEAAASALKNGDHKAAEHHAGKSAALKYSTEADRILAMSAVYNRHFSVALAAWTRLASPGDLFQVPGKPR